LTSSQQQKIAPKGKQTVKNKCKENKSKLQKEVAVRSTLVKGFPRTLQASSKKFLIFEKFVAASSSVWKASTTTRAGRAESADPFPPAEVSSANIAR